MADPIHDDEAPKKRIVKALVRISLRGGSELLFRHTDPERAYHIIDYVGTRMHKCFMDDRENPFVSSVVMKDEFEKTNGSRCVGSGKEISDVAFGPRQKDTSCVDVRDIMAIAMVCPGCCQVVSDLLPGHIIDEDGDCNDPLIEGVP